LNKISTGKEVVDQKARERAIGDLDRSLCVEAGAGTGKTTLLVNRYLSIIRKGKALPTEIVAITFTDKAAGEMKVRLREEIQSILKSQQCKESERERFIEAQYELERAPISTIHSFCSSIIREFAIAAGVNPGFQLLSDVEGNLYFQECWRDFLSVIKGPQVYFLEKFFRRGGAINRLMGIATYLYERRGERHIEEIVESCHDRYSSDSAGNAQDLEDWVSDVGSRRKGIVNAVAFSKDVEEAREYFCSLLENHCRDEEDGGAAEIRGFLAETEDINGLKGDQLEEFLLSIKVPNANRGNKKNWDPPHKCSEFKELARNLKNVQSRYRRRFMDSLRDFIYYWAYQLVDYVQERKREDGFLDFNDLLIISRRLLDNRAILEVLRKRYRYILVDEFQDTDPLQAEIVMMLSDELGSLRRDSSGRGKLFIVGDPKQSIYRFRNADIEIYQKVKKALSGEDSIIEINQNFRSLPGIINWVNMAFSQLMTGGDEEDFKPEYEAIHPYREASGSSVVLLNMELDQSEERADQVRSVEAESIARFIHHLIEQGVEIEDPVDGVVRPIGYGDIAILYRGTTGVENYENTLRSEGIPYLVEGGKLFFTRQEIRDLANAMWVIEDPWDSLSLTSVLRSPLFGFSDEELFMFVRRGGNINYLDGKDTVDGNFEDFIKAFHLLADLHKGRNVRGPAETLNRLIIETGYIHLCCIRSHGEQIVLNIRKLIQRAREFEKKGNSFRSFARWFRDQDEQETAEGEFPMLDENEEAVKMLTIHKSKGLQFPVVIMANLVQKMNHHPWVILVKGGRLSFKLRGEWKTSDYDTMLEREKLRDNVESVRLLYVAATRARDLLVIPKSPLKKRSYFEILAPYLTGEDKGDRKGKVSDLVQAVKVSDLPSLKATFRLFESLPGEESVGTPSYLEKKRVWEARRKEVIEKARLAPLVINPSMISEDKVHTDGVVRDSLPRVREMERNLDGKDYQQDLALRFGLAYHSVMNRIDFKSKNIERITEPAVREFEIESAGKELHSLVSKTLSSDIISDARDSTLCLREVPFTIPVNDDFIDGRIDLLFYTEGAWSLVDYKTDRVDEEMIDERKASYRSQICLYYAAINRMGLEPVDKLAIYFPRIDTCCYFQVSTQLLEEADKIIHALSKKKEDVC
jgi:ATP-dependent helicase/nuclease subunit A